MKITTWNLEHADRLIGNDLSDSLLDRKRRVNETIAAIDPDILCLVEGPRGEKTITNFCNDVLDGKYTAILLKHSSGDLDGKDKDYQIKGTQWIWFIVRSSISENCRLQDPKIWQSFTNEKTWIVNYWGKEKSTRHSHYRHPQVMIYTFENGKEMELIGVHLKSKINKKPIKWEDGSLTGEYLATALKARVKLAMEARNIRNYVDAKFKQAAFPGIMIMGDCNDGPGHDYFETQYLFFDLIGNLQGDVLSAEKYFNHALFDFPGNLRWTAKYRNKLLGIPASKNPLLLDHILISQPLCNNKFPLNVDANAGLVEHEAFERGNAGSNSKTRSSDHRPVSCVLT